MQPTPAPPTLSGSDKEMLDRFQGQYKLLKEQIHRVIVGQETIIELLLLALFARGHVLLIGVPGLGKTLLIKTLAGVLGWKFRRIQFTPDMMPSDITGTEILQTDPATGERKLHFVRGPVFANLILADEINRTPPKTQAALLESMQEYTVTAGGQTYPLELPFLVAATQNPIEHEGTYPLPEAQLDRFMFSLEINYPERNDEIHMVEETTAHDYAQVQPVMSRDEVMRYQEFIRRIPVARHVLEYAVDLAQASRPTDGQAFINDYVEWGAGPRASQYLILGAKALALIRGLPAPSCAEIREVAISVMRHRVIPNYNAMGKNVTSRMIVEHLLASVPERDYAGNLKPLAAVFPKLQAKPAAKPAAETKITKFLEIRKKSAE